LDPLTVLYQDSYLIAIDKPSGLLVHPSKLATDRITCMSLLRDQIGQWVYPAHRLDRGTSGVLLFSLDSETAAGIGTRFRERDVEKRYLGVVRGWAPAEGDIDHPLAEEQYDPPQPARTRFQTLAQAELPYPVGRYETARYSLVRAEPITGRMHQIRRHMKHISHPIVGDTLFGHGAQNRFFRATLDSHRLLLHAEMLTLEHPHTGERLIIKAAPPEEMRKVFEQLGWGSLETMK
jgi:tRNA pseudouridine65 synthase